MAGMSDYLENAVQNYLWRNVSYTAPATVYAALYTAAPSDAGGGTEVSGSNYSRVAITFAASSGGVVTNSGAIVQFPLASGSWGTVGWMGIFDASSAGNLMAWAALPSTLAVVSGDAPYWPTSTLSVSLD